MLCRGRKAPVQEARLYQQCPAKHVQRASEPACVGL
jgi:hypothetical protein